MQCGMISVVSMKVAIMQMLTEPKTLLTFRMRSPTERVPSSSAGPPDMILVRKIPSSPRTCWLPRPPAMLKPRPGRGGERGWPVDQYWRGYVLIRYSRREGLNIHVHDCTHTAYENDAWGSDLCIWEWLGNGTRYMIPRSWNVQVWKSVLISTAW